MMTDHFFSSYACALLLAQADLNVRTTRVRIFMPDDMQSAFLVHDTIDTYVFFKEAIDVGVEEMEKITICKLAVGHAPSRRPASSHLFALCFFVQRSTRKQKKNLIMLNVERNRL